jgi:2-oxoisovalerate dehydrogenase E2 component (dihydrolipoyl transacylase)
VDHHSVAWTFETVQILTTPAVRKIAKENGIDLGLVPSTGPRGRILKSDVLAFMESGGSSQSSPAPAVAAPPMSSGTTVVPISGLQRIMVRSMNESLKIPHFTYSEEVVMDALAAVRGPLNALGAAQGVKISYLPLVLKALSLSLHQFPVLNSSVSKDETSITYHGDHNIGVAMDTPRGLLVPNIKQVQFKSVFEIAAELNELQALGAAAKLGEAHLTGGTITVSNMGSIGGTVLSPVIMAPQTAIVALGRIQTLPRYAQGQEGVVSPTKVMNVSWAGDHRVIDGATMARFVNTWRGFLENPALMLAHLK